MKNLILLFASISFVCFFSKISNAQAPDWIWAKSAAGTGDDWAYSVAVDASGNIYVAGWFYSPTIIFGSDTLTNSGSSTTTDLFLAKYDASGNVLWAKSAGGTVNDVAYSVAVDVSGYVYLTGSFSNSSIIFGSDTLMNAGGGDIFLAKYDANGNILWAKSAGSTSVEGATSIAVDTSGNTYIAGYFKSPTITFGSNTLINADSTSNTTDLFLAKYDANGNVLWSKSAGGTKNDRAASVAMLVSGNIYLTGHFYSSTIIFDSTTLTNAGTNIYCDIFLAKYNANGNVLWAKSAGGIKNDLAYSVAVDTSGNSYIAGCFSSPTLTFSSTILTNVGSTNLFLAKYDANGNVLWAKSAGGTSNDYALSIAVDASENTCIAGYFYSTPISFGSDTLSNAGNNDIFLAKYDVNGNMIWAKSVGGTSYDEALSVAMDASENIYVAGWFYSPAIIFGSDTLTNVFNYDIFIAKFKDTTVITFVTILTDNKNGIKIFPNPATENITIIIPQKAIIEILNINGQIIKTIYNNSKEMTIDLRNLSSGVYIIKAKTDKEIVTKKFIKE